MATLDLPIINKSGYYFPVDTEYLPIAAFRYAIAPTHIVVDLETSRNGNMYFRVILRNDKSAYCAYTIDMRTYKAKIDAILSNKVAYFATDECVHSDEREHRISFLKLDKEKPTTWWCFEDFEIVPYELGCARLLRLADDGEYPSRGGVAIIEDKVAI